VFEASANPGGPKFQGWDEAVDQCNNTQAITPPPFTIRIPPATDNTQAGQCNSMGGYTSLSEIQVYGWTYSDYRNEYNSLWPQGWRLYSLQSYVVSGQVLYNAVWRPQGNLPEIQAYGWAYSDFRSAMTHAGQLAMLRRLAGVPVAPENFAFAGIHSNRLGPDQPPPAAPDAIWPERLAGDAPAESISSTLPS
jgi:Bacterial tandem repeat domain 1